MQFYFHCAVGSNSFNDTHAQNVYYACILICSMFRLACVNAYTYHFIMVPIGRWEDLSVQICFTSGGQSESFLSDI